MGVTVLIELRRRTYGSSEAQEDLAAGRSRMAVTRVERREMRMEYATRGRFMGLGLKTRAEVPRRNGAARGGITEVASR
jgi:hypothetical protein